MKCNYCEWHCNLEGSKYGICRMYHEDNGIIKERFPFKWSTYRVSRIEAIPFYHIHPGSRCMTIGTAGCNLSCRYCSNAFIAKEIPDKVQDKLYSISPGDLVQMAVKRGCRAIVFNVNEPAVSIQSLYALSKAAKSSGIPMGCLTNGYTTVESTELLASIFSFFNISLKGLSPEFCREYLGIPDAYPVLRNIETLASLSHVEVTTPVIESVNDSDLSPIADFLARVEREIPWHVFRLLPEYKMRDTVYPNIEAINDSLEKVRQELPYVYFHNFIGSDWVNTICPECGEILIERLSLGCGGDRLMKSNCSGNECPGCGYGINLNGKKPALYLNREAI